MKENLLLIIFLSAYGMNFVKDKSEKMLISEVSRLEFHSMLMESKMNIQDFCVQFWLILCLPERQIHTEIAFIKLVK